MHPGGWPVAEDSRVPPLPQRVPGRNRGSGTGPLLPPVVLSESVLQRIRAALDGAADLDDAEDKTSPLQDAAEGKVSSRQNAATSERPASLSRPVRDPGRGPEPPVGTVRPRWPSPGQMRLQQTNLRLSPRPGWAGWLRRSRRHRTPRPSPRPPQTYRPTRRRPLLSRPRQYNTRISKTARTRRPARRRRRPIGRTGRPARRRHSPAGRRQRSAPRSQDRRGRRHSAEAITAAGTGPSARPHR